MDPPLPHSTPGPARGEASAPAARVPSLVQSLMPIELTLGNSDVRFTLQDLDSLPLFGGQAAEEVLRAGEAAETLSIFANGPRGVPTTRSRGAAAAADVFGMDDDDDDCMLSSSSTADFDANVHNYFDPLDGGEQAPAASKIRRMSRVLKSKMQSLLLGIPRTMIGLLNEGNIDRIKEYVAANFHEDCIVNGAEGQSRFGRDHVWRHYTALLETSPDLVVIFQKAFLNKLSEVVYSCTVHGTVLPGEVPDDDLVWTAEERNMSRDYLTRKLSDGRKRPLTRTEIEYVAQTEARIRNRTALANFEIQVVGKLSFEKEFEGEVPLVTCITRKWTLKQINSVPIEATLSRGSAKRTTAAAAKAAAGLGSKKAQDYSEDDEDDNDGDDGDDDDLEDLA